MTTRLLYAALAALTLAAPAFAQSKDGHDAEPPAASGAPDAGQAARPADGSDGRLYIKLEKGGEVIFKPVGPAAGPEGKAQAPAEAPPPAKKKLKYKGYSKKGLSKYKKAAAEKRLAKGAAESLSEAKAEKAKELAAEAEMNEDVRDTIKEKIRAADEAGKPAAEKEKLMAAEEAAKSMDNGIKRKMKDFEQKEAGGQKVFKEPAADPGGEGKAGESQGAPDDSSAQPGRAPAGGSDSGGH